MHIIQPKVEVLPVDGPGILRLIEVIGRDAVRKVRCWQ